MKKKIYLGGEEIPEEQVMPKDFKEFFERLIKYLVEGKE